MDSYEIKIRVPWGFVAGKWFGPKQTRPILCIHGWQDNASTFDRLIPLLPKHISFLTIDLPGHGLSSHLNVGRNYDAFHYVYLIRMIQKEYNWDKISLMGHSLGGVLGSLFSCIWPDDVDLMIAIDGIISNVHSNAEVLQKQVNQFFVYHDKQLETREPPSYTYTDAIKRLCDNPDKSITTEAAKLLFTRAAVKSEKFPKKYYFRRDARVKVYTNLLVSMELLLVYFERLVTPMIFIKAENSQYFGPKQNTDDILEVLKKKPKFESYIVHGRHHLHLTNPERISGLISDFINKYRPVDLGNKEEVTGYDLPLSKL